MKTQMENSVEELEDRIKSSRVGKKKVCMFIYMYVYVYMCKREKIRNEKRARSEDPTYE